MSRPRSAWKKFLGQDGLRRLTVASGKAAAGTAAAAAGLALGLKALKQQQKAEEATCIWPTASFDLHDHTPWRGEQQLERVCKLGGFTRGDFQAAARRLRPVELQLLEFAAASKAAGGNEAAEAALAQKWRDDGFLEELTGPSRREIFGKRLTTDAQGVDIGTLVPSALAQEAGVPAVSSPCWETAANVPTGTADALREWGCAVLRGALSADDVAATRKALGLGNGLAARRAAEVGQWLQQSDANVGMGRYTYGRLHCLLRGSEEFEEKAVAVHAAVAPAVHAYFDEDQRAGRHVFLSEAQLIVADPCAEGQGWHLDRVGCRGLSVVVPLSNISTDRGLQSVLPGTHHLTDSALPLGKRIRSCLRALCATHGAVAAAPDAQGVWRAGDALLLDSRLMHRSLPNDSLGAPSACLVLRYDLQDSPPPGCTRFFLRAMTQTGSVLDAVFRLYSVV